MERIIIAIGADDHLVTKSSLVQMGCTTCTDTSTSTSTSTSTDRRETNSTNEESVPHHSNIHTSEFKYGNASITVITMPKECNGSADAMRYIIAANIIETQSHVMVLPADLVLYGNMTDANTATTSNTNDNYDYNSNGDQEQDHVIVDALGSLADVHRREYRVGVEKGMPLGMSMLLADVGEEDESGVPLKESSKVCELLLVSSFVVVWTIQYCMDSFCVLLIIDLIVIAIAIANHNLQSTGKEGGHRT